MLMAPCWPTQYLQKATQGAFFSKLCRRCNKQHREPSIQSSSGIATADTRLSIQSCSGVATADTGLSIQNSSGVSTAETKSTVCHGASNGKSVGTHNLPARTIYLHAAQELPVGKEWRCKEGRACLVLATACLLTHTQWRVSDKLLQGRSKWDKLIAMLIDGNRGQEGEFETVQAGGYRGEQSPFPAGIRHTDFCDVPYGLIRH